MTAVIQPRQQGDVAAIEVLLDEAFGTDRRLKRSYAYRVGLDPISELSFSAMEGDRLVGTISVWPVAIGDAPQSALLVGPVAVTGSLRAVGLGSALMRTCLERARELGYGMAVLVGDLSYYGRFGFVSATAFGIEMPDENPVRVLALPLRKETAMPGRIDHWRSVRLGQRAA